MEEDGRQAKTSQSPNHSDNEKRKQELRLDFTQRIYEICEMVKKNQETHCPLWFSYRPKTIGKYFMKRCRIIDSASQSDMDSEKGSNVHNEENKNQEALNCWFPFWPRILVDHTMEQKEIEVSAAQSPNHSYKASNAHNEGRKNQETLRRLCFPYWPRILDHTMERTGIESSAAQSPNHSYKASNAHNEFQAPKMQTIQLWDDLYFSSQVMPLKHYTTPSVVKDESTVQNRDKADRSQKVTDMPEVLDTHLTKEDVDSIVPQNNWRERIFNLWWKHLSVLQVIVVLLLMTPFTHGISSHCDTSRTMNCTQLFLTCSFDTDIIRLAKNFYMNHLQDNSVHLEIIVVCQMSSKGFHCETSPTYEFVSVESNRLTVKIPEVSKEHVGKYWCDVHGFADIDQKVCQLSVTDTSSEDCFQQVNGPSDKDDRFSPAIIAVIVLGISLALVVTSIIFICFISSGSAKYIATCFNFKNCKSGKLFGRNAPTTISEEECENL